MKRKCVIGVGVGIFFLFSVLTLWKSIKAQSLILFIDIQGTVYAKTGTGYVPVPNTQVILKDKDGDILSTTTTDSNGHYQFCDIRKWDNTPFPWTVYVPILCTGVQTRDPHYQHPNYCGDWDYRSVPDPIDIYGVPCASGK